jgi:hypothetical protein
MYCFQKIRSSYLVARGHARQVPPSGVCCSQGKLPVPLYPGPPVAAPAVGASDVSILESNNSLQPEVALEPTDRPVN